MSVSVCVCVCAEVRFHCKYNARFVAAIKLCSTRNRIAQMANVQRLCYYAGQSAQKIYIYTENKVKLLPLYALGEIQRTIRSLTIGRDSFAQERKLERIRVM